MEELLISPADPKGSPAKEQQAAGVGILLQIMMLVLSFVLGHVLRRHRFYYLPEASASLLIGNLVSTPVFNSTSTYPNFLPDDHFIIVSRYLLYVQSVILSEFEMWGAGMIVGGLANISNTENSIRSHANNDSSFDFFFYYFFFIALILVQLMMIFFSLKSLFNL